MEQAVVDLRREHPTKGAHVLAQMLKNRGYEGVPSKSTITAVLRRHGLIDPAESTKRQPYKRFEHDEPNQMWQMDFKGHVAMGRDRCHPYDPGRPLQVLSGAEGLWRREGKDRPGTTHPHLLPLWYALHHVGGQRLSLGQ